MTPKVKYWQWPNVLSIDAALIAVLWQMALAEALDTKLSLPTYTVLGLSVWLSYAADRLFDVASREKASLLSLRHQFAKRHTGLLWGIWLSLLGTNLLLATQLTRLQIEHGLELLLASLFYTLLNQKLSRRFFPKEICVALIYAGGVVIFLRTHAPAAFVGLFALLCFLNCLIIGAKEKAIDAKMQIHSMVPIITERWLIPLACLGAALALWLQPPLHTEIASSFALLGLLQFYRGTIPIENFRVLADGALLITACLTLLN